MANLEARGIPTVGVATTEFIQGAEAQAKALGTDPALVFIPHPVQDRTDAELRALADEYFEAIVKLLLKS
jgi:alkanesulfonate monooxygenase SsuD/methylene tetrahydromethanopterin reductase-like flavin-dependent oxidoreductase (luciferase family)